MTAYVTTNTTYFIKDQFCAGARSHHAGKRTSVPSGAPLIWPPKLGDRLVFVVGDRRVITTEVLAVRR